MAQEKNFLVLGEGKWTDDDGFNFMRIALEENMGLNYPEDRQAFEGALEKMREMGWCIQAMLLNKSKKMVAMFIRRN